MLKSIAENLRSSYDNIDTAQDSLPYLATLPCIDLVLSCEWFDGVCWQLRLQEPTLLIDEYSFRGREPYKFARAPLQLEVDTKTGDVSLASAGACRKGRLISMEQARGKRWQWRGWHLMTGILDGPYP